MFSSMTTTVTITVTITVPPVISWASAVAVAVTTEGRGSIQALRPPVLSCEPTAWRLQRLESTPYFTVEP